MKHFYILFLIVFSINFAFAQDITGTVTDSSGIPLAGVNVLEKGTMNGVITDFNGNYSISVNSDATLVFSYVGYNTAEVEVNNQTSINVSLQEGVSLDEIILVGSRSPRRTATDTPVPVDVIDVANLATTTGKVEINEILQYAAPSFNATKQSGSDGADHIVPASFTWFRT